MALISAVIGGGTMITLGYFSIFTRVSALEKDVVILGEKMSEKFTSVEGKLANLEGRLEGKLANLEGKLDRFITAINQNSSDTKSEISYLKGVLQGRSDRSMVVEQATKEGLLKSN